MGVYPFFPCAYIDRDAQNHCYIVGGEFRRLHLPWHLGAAAPDWAMRDTGASLGPNDCASVVGGTKLWQYRIDTTCGTAYDFDLSTPAGGDDEAAYMLYIY